jgi:ribosome-associated protein
MMDLRTKQRLVVEALEDVKGYDILVFNTARLPTMFERVVIATGDSNRQLKALADRVQERVVEQGASVVGVEGESSGEWVLVDLGDVVVHIMHPTVREFYNLEEIWGGKTVRMKAETKAPTKAPKKKAKTKAKARAKAPRRRAKR